MQHSEVPRYDKIIAYQCECDNQSTLSTSHTAYRDCWTGSIWFKLLNHDTVVVEGELGWLFGILCNAHQHDPGTITLISIFPRLNCFHIWCERDLKSNVGTSVYHGRPSAIQGFHFFFSPGGPVSMSSIASIEVHGLLDVLACFRAFQLLLAMVSLFTVRSNN